MLTFKRNLAMRKFLPITYLLTLLTGCATSIQVGNTPRSSIEQRLLISSFERALARLDTQKFNGKTVTVDFYGLTPDKDLAKETLLTGSQVPADWQRSSVLVPQIKAAGEVRE